MTELSGPATRPAVGLRALAARAAYESMTVAARWPVVVQAAARITDHGVLVDSGSDLVVEGYPRSGNSLAVAALAQAQPRPIRIAHHIHAPGHVILAVRRRVPVLLVIRPPEDAAVELVVTKPHLTVRLALRGYVRFHAPLVRHRTGFVVATFDEVHDDLAAVVRRLNQRFETLFAEPTARGHSEDAVAERMQDYWAERTGPGLPVVGRGGARSGDEQAILREWARRAVRAPSCAAPLRRAAELHGLLIDVGSRRGRA